MSKQFKKSLIKATGGIHIGHSFMKSFQASWPFGRIDVYDDRIVLKVQYIPNFILKLFKAFGRLSRPTIGSYKDVPKEIYLQYDEIKGYKEGDAKILGYGITFVHTNNQYPPFLQVWISKNKAKEIIGYLNNKRIFKFE